MVNFAGRDIRFRHPIPAQLIILRRRLLRLQQQANQAEDESQQLELGSQLIVDMLNVVESLVVDKEDVEFLEQAMLEGKVTHEEVMDVLRAQPPTPQPAKKRTPAKPAMKATANRGRTKR